MAEDPTGETPADIVGRIGGAAQRIEVPCGQGRMVWHVWGDGEPLVLLHGSFGSWTHWLRNIEGLSTRYRVIAGDIPGMGDSDEPTQPFTIESLGAEVAGALDHVLPPPARFHFAGFSFGGIVGGQVCVLRKDRLQSYTAVGSNALGLHFGKRPDMAKPSSKMLEDELLAVHRHNLGVTMIADPAKVDVLALHLQMTNTRRARVRSGAIPRGDSLARALREMPAPIHGIWGEHDQTAGEYLEERRALFQAIQPDCRFDVVPGAGHWAAFESPDVVNRYLMAFLAAHPIAA